MLAALQQLYQAIISAPGNILPTREPQYAPPSNPLPPHVIFPKVTPPKTGPSAAKDQLRFRGPLTVTTDASSRSLVFGADARTRTCVVRHTGVIRPCQMHLVALHGNGESFSIRLTDRLGGCVQLAAHVVDQYRGQWGNRVSLRLNFQGLTDHLDETHPQLTHSGSMSGHLELRGRINDPASWTCRLMAEYHAAPEQFDTTVTVQQSQPQYAA